MLGPKPLADTVATISPLLSLGFLYHYDDLRCTFVLSGTLWHESHDQGHHGPNMTTQFSQGSTNRLVSRHGSCML